MIFSWKRLFYYIQEHWQVVIHIASAFLSHLDISATACTFEYGRYIAKLLGYHSTPVRAGHLQTGG